MFTSRITYGFSQLFHVRNQHHSSLSKSAVIATIINGIFHPRSRRAGTHIRRVHLIKTVESVRQRPLTKPRGIDSRNLSTIKCASSYYAYNNKIPSICASMVENGTGMQPLGLLRQPAMTKSRDIDSRNLFIIKCVSSYNNNRNVSVGLWNARSLVNKIPSICASMMENKTDIQVITETWLSPSREKIIFSEFRSTLSGYQFFSRPRLNRKGGGVAAMIRDGLEVNVNNNRKFTSFEHLDLSVSLKPKLLRLLIVYRPPPSPKNGQTFSKFLNEFSELLQIILLSPGRLFILGDFNLHVDNKDCRDACQFLDLINSLGLIQHLQLPTHCKGHTLDLVLTRASEVSCLDVRISDDLPSDHSLVIFNSDLTRPAPTKITRASRNHGAANTSALTDFLSKNPFPVKSGMTPDQLADVYHSHLTKFMDLVAPVKTKSFLVKSRAPWFDGDIMAARCDLRQHERRWKTSGLEVFKQVYHAKRTQYNNLLNEARMSYHRSKVNNATDQRQLFSVVDELIGERKSTSSLLPRHGDARTLANQFSDFFTSKIDKLCSRFMETSHNEIVLYNRGHSFSEFKTVTSSELSKLINSMKAKLCPLDAIRTDLLK